MFYWDQNPYVELHSASIGPKREKSNKMLLAVRLSLRKCRERSPC